MAAAPTQKQLPEELCLYPTLFNHKDIQTGSSLLEFTWWCLFLTCRSEHSQSKLWSQRSLQSQQQEQVNARRPHTISASWHISRGRLKENNKQKANSQHDPPEGDPSSEGFSPQLEESRTSQQPWPNSEPLLCSLPPQDQQSSLQQPCCSTEQEQSSWGWSNLANKNFPISDLGQVFLLLRM